ncbi:Divergent AAA domain protein [Pseudovibrio sp. Ad5]|uniref:AlbA family DNA-binding domain-containing protein n=1 Tax=Pseudovibrio sp. Ad5 TaxID=989436 RepID=UPI0007B1F230|nr:ATP-binding protein [Pseudovibrio sp. Ad5]KZK88841.1 Divergent AAA domain protein [Pseudovibrio sp. Ad5]
MNTAELEVLLEGAIETDRLEFKGAMLWDKHSLVKDILAMANLQDGGTIIFGVEDGTFARQGLNNDQIASFDIDTMKDQIAPYADPFVNFHCTIAQDNDGRNYAILSVQPFEELPVICKRDGTDVSAGVIYFRPQSGRAQSAQVSNSNDMRKIVELSIARRTQQLQMIGLLEAPEQAEETVTEDNQQDYDAELGDL